MESIGRRPVCPVLITLLCCATISARAGMVRAEPDVLIFRDTAQSETLMFMVEDAALPPSAITGWRLLVDARDYSHMFRFDRTDTGLRLTPSATVEIGSYLLVVETRQGSASVTVYTPLTEQQSSVERLAARINVSVDDIRLQMGASQRMGREQVALNVSPVHHHGQQLDILIPGDDSHYYVWKINGESVFEGVGARHFTHILQDSGLMLLEYEERLGDRVVATASALTEVIPRVPMPHETRVNTRVVFQGPPGFGHYTWRLHRVSASGRRAARIVPPEQAGENATFEHVFTEPGEYSLEVISESPLMPTIDVFRGDKYHVTVKE